MRQQIFVRLDWQDALLKYLDLGVVSFIDPLDRSALAQLSVQYAVSKHWTLGVHAPGVFGASNQEKGSLP